MCRSRHIPRFDRPANCIERHFWPTLRNTPIITIGKLQQPLVSRRLLSFWPFVSLESLVKKATLYKERDEKKRQAFIAELETLNSEDLVYVDESGIDHHHFRKYAKSPKNTRVYGDISGNYLPRTTLIAGYVEGGFIAPFRFKGYTNPEVFNLWVETCLVPDLRKGMVVIMDNARFHKSDKTVELIESAGCRVLFQPPYSPDLNKIEPMWANIKQRLNSFYDTALSFTQNLDYHFKDMCKC